MKRRDALKIGASAAALPVLVPAQTHEHAKPEAKTAAAKDSWKPVFLTPAQNDALVALADVIIPATDTPGAKAAQVNRYIDRMLEAMPARDRERFATAISAIDEASQKQHSGPFAKLTPDQQVAVLTELDKSAAGTPGNTAFRGIKSLVTRVFYQTALGYRDLNKGGIPKSWACAHTTH